MDLDDLQPKKAKTYELGRDLAELSVGELLRGKNLAQRFDRRFDKQTLDARNLHAVDAATAGRLRGCIGR